MTGKERQSVISLALLYATRMLGLFMVLPVFVLYGQQLEGSTELLMGVAIGAYGLSQAIFQVPFGALSDRFGRKRLISIGLVLFFLGSVLAAVSEDIYGVIVGRFLQGSGAIASVLMALLSDITSEESRTKAMAMIGMSIGVSFSVALVVGPLFGELFGLQGIFWLTAGLAVFGLFWLWMFVPTPVQGLKHRETRLFKDQLGATLRNKELLRLDWGIFALHLCLTAMFIAVPMSLLNKVHVPAEDHWLVYLTVMVFSFFSMVPFIIVGEKKRKMRPVFLFAIALLAVSALSAQWTLTDFWGFWFSLFFFFMAFNLLEASLPSLVSKISPAGGKGTAMGVYSTSQFFGAFVGGVIGGWVLSLYGESGVYVFVSVMCLLWLGIAFGMKNPNPETAMALHFEQIKSVDNAQLISEQLSLVPGVEEVVVIPEDAIAYLKVIKTELDLEALQQKHKEFGGLVA